MKCKLKKHNTYGMEITQSHVLSVTYQHNAAFPEKRTQILCDCTYLHMSMMGLYDQQIKYGIPIVDKKASYQNTTSLACFSFKSAYYKLKGLSHAYCVGVPTVNHVRQTWSNKRCGEIVLLLQCIHGPKKCKSKKG